MSDQTEDEKRPYDSYDPIDDGVFYDLSHGVTSINIERQKVLDKKPMTLLELYHVSPYIVIELIKMKTKVEN